MDVDRDRMIEVALASPRLVAAHDRAGWLALFAADATIEDPVGTAPHRRSVGARGPGDDELGRFWDVFIAPNQIRFEPVEDIVSPPFVVRDVLIHTRPAGGPALRVPAHLIYEVCEEAGELRIKHLAAHWEIGGVSKQALLGGLSGLAALGAQSWRMLKIQRLSGTAGYARGLVGGIGTRGRKALRRFARAVDAADERALVATFVDAGERVAFPVGRSLTPARFLEELGPNPGLNIRDVRVAGWVVSFGFEALRRGAPLRGLGFLDFDPGAGQIAGARLFHG